MFNKPSLFLNIFMLNAKMSATFLAIIAFPLASLIVGGKCVFKIVVVISSFLQTCTAEESLGIQIILEHILSS